MAPTMPQTLCIDHRSNPPSKTVELESSENKRTESGILEVLIKYIRFDEWLKFSEDVLGLELKDIVQYRQKFEEFVANMKKEMIEKSGKEPEQLLSEYVSKQNLIKPLANEMKTEQTDKFIHSFSQPDKHYPFYPLTDLQKSLEYDPKLQNPYVYKEKHQQVGSGEETNPDDDNNWGSDLHGKSTTLSEVDEEVDAELYKFKDSGNSFFNEDEGSSTGATEKETSMTSYTFEDINEQKEEVADLEMIDMKRGEEEELSSYFSDKDFPDFEDVDTSHNGAEGTVASAIGNETSREPSNQTFETQTDKESVENSEVQMEITSEGGELGIDDCKVIFPEDAVDEPIIATIYLSFDISQWPEGMTAVSPMLRCLSSGTTTFKRPIKIELTTWLCSGEGSEVSIMNYSEKRDQKWIEIAKAVPNEEGKIVFEVEHFCKNVAAIARDDMNHKIRIVPFLYRKDDKHFVSVFCRRCETSERKVRKEFFGYDKPLPLMNEMKAKRSDVISFNLYTRDRAIMKFIEGKQSVKVDDVMSMAWRVGYFTPTEDVEKQKIKFIYVIKLNKGEYKPPKHFFIIDWLYPKPTHSQVVIIVKPQVGRDVHCRGKGNTVIEKRVMQSDSDA